MRADKAASGLTSGDQDESGAGVDDAGRAGQDGRAVVRDGLVDTPVVRGGAGRGQRAVHLRQQRAVRYIGL